MQCVILAGGLGTRIRGRSGDLPKALIPVRGKPFVFYQLEWLARQDVHQVVLSVGYRGDLISAAVGDGSRFGLSVTYADEGETLRGTGGALRYIADIGMLEPGFFVLYGDSYLPIDLTPVWHTSEGGRICTMTVLHNAGKWDASNVLIRDQALVLYDKAVADPASIGMQYIDYGLSVLTRLAIIDGIAAEKVVDLAELLKKLSVAGRLKAHEVFQRFYEIGSPQGLDDFVAYIAKSEGAM